MTVAAYAGAMSQEDREKWNARYQDESRAPAKPSVLLLELERFLPSSGRALDVAGGAGRHSIWLARRGLEVTLVDISHRGLAFAQERATEAGVSIRTVESDLEQDGLPEGKWNLIVGFHYLQ